MNTIDFENELNAEQHAAATASDGPLLVLAAAGTGKTRTLVYRVAYLLGKGIPPDRILLLTFTNRAAAEMLERTQALVGTSVSGMWGGTFHHMANRVLRRHATALGYPNDYTILDREDSLTLVQNAVKEAGLRTPDFPKAEVLLGLFSAAANTEKPLIESVEQRFRDTPVEPSDVARVGEAYQKKKRDLKAMDFDDLLVNGLKLFREHPALLERYQQQFIHTLVDEYQDTNTIQAEWVDRIASGHRNLLVVGDDFQSIYGWRGADYLNIMSFPKRYPDARTIVLETNYRSVPDILAVANACIAGNPHQFQKKLRATREASRKPTVARVRDGDTQARYAIEQIRKLRQSGYKMSDIAVLYRAHFHSMDLQINLARERIPYVITSGVRFFEQAHIKDVCSLLRIIQNPEDELSFVRLLSLLPKVGNRTADKIWAKLGGRFVAQDPQQRQALAAALPGEAREIWKRIDPIFSAWEKEDLKSDPGEAIYQFQKAFYDQFALTTFENYERRIEDIRELALFTTKFESAEEFLSEIALLTNLDAEQADTANQNKDGLRLSTVHQAKGLEWRAVILLWATEGMFPSSRSLDENTVGGEAEERRLFYVAVTRAKDELVFCVPEVRRTNDGGVIYCSPSRFLEEIPRHLLHDDHVGFI